jgi:hypothetical protein
VNRGGKKKQTGRSVEETNLERHIVVLDYIVQENTYKGGLGSERRSGAAAILAASISYTDRHLAALTGLRRRELHHHQKNDNVTKGGKHGSAFPIESGHRSGNDQPWRPGVF